MRDLRGTATRRYLRLPWGQVHVRDSGVAGGPCVVLLHQSPLSSATFESILEPLARAGVHAVAIDTPGFGMSDAVGERWDITDYAAALWQVLDALGLDRVVLLGQHTGAVIAWEATIQHRDRVAGLIVQGLPLYDEAEREQKRSSYAPGYRPDESGDHLRVVWQRIRGLYPDLPVDEADRQVLEYLCAGPDYATAYRAVFDYVVRPERLAGHPIVLIHGDRDLVHRFTPVLEAALPRAQVELLAGGTDFVADEQPEKFAATVARWVRALTTEKASA